MLNVPALLVIVNCPSLSANSLALVAVQYNVVASGTLVVAILIVNGLPSFILVAAGVASYVGESAGVKLVSLIVILSVVSTTVPAILPVLI